MNKAKNLLGQIKIGLVIGLLTVLMGCAGYMGGGYYGRTVVMSEPDEYLFGGEYYYGRDAYHYSHRGAESRGAVHSSGRQGGRR